MRRELAEPAFLIRAAAFLLALAAAVATPADADLWGHLTFGRDIVSSGRLVQHDSYSFTSDREWINHEWLSEVIFFVMYQGIGAVGLIVVKLAAVAGLLTIVARRLRYVGTTWDVVGLLVLLVFVGTYWRMHTIRPQLLAVPLFAGLLLILTRVDTGWHRGLWLVPAVFALWVNLHGSWIVGLGMLLVWSAGGTLESHRAGHPVQLGRAGAGVIAVLATLANPHGPSMWSFLAQTVRLSRSDIQDWSPIASEPIALGIPWGLTMGAALLAVRASNWQARPTYLAMTGLLAVTSLRVSRLDAFFAVAVAVLMAPELASAAAPVVPPKTKIPRDPSVAALIVAALAISGMLLPFGMFARRYGACLTIGGSWPPEPEAAQFVLLNQLRGRMLTFFDWGQYAIWHFAPDVKVSMDGRRETVYSNDMVVGHWRLYEAQPGADQFLQRINPDFVWLPRNIPFAKQLASEGWTPIFNGPVSTIFTQMPLQTFRNVEPIPTAMRCFPGP